VKRADGINLWAITDIQHFFWTQSPEPTSVQKSFRRRLKGVDLGLCGTQCDGHPVGDAQALELIHHRIVREDPNLYGSVLQEGTKLH
jgi:hypothetical protein